MLTSTGSYVCSYVCQDFVRRTSAHLKVPRDSMPRTCAFIERGWLAAAWFTTLFLVNASFAGIDHIVSVDDSGIWNNGVQKGVEYGAIAAEVAGRVLARR